MLLVDRDNGGGFLARLRRDQEIRVETVSGRTSGTALLRAQLGSRSPGGRCHGDVVDLSRQLVEPLDAALGVEAQELAAKLVVGDLGEQHLVIDERTHEPVAYVVVLARMADPAEHARIE